MPLLPKFDTPAGIRDLPEGSAFYDTWHTVIDTLIGDGRLGTGGIGEFYNAARKDVKPVTERFMNWMGFPRPLIMQERDNRQKAFQDAEVRVNADPIQGEYFEWFVTRSGGKIKKVTFTTEMRLYWRELFKFDRDRVLALYRELVSPAVRMADLVNPDDTYNPLNVWNTKKGIVHYIVGINDFQPANGVSQGSVNRVPPPHATDSYDLEPRAGTLELFSADNRMLFDINAFARKNLAVTFREPIGLYMTDWDDTGFTKPDGSPVGNYWRIVRGKPGMALRLEYEVPASEGFMVSDIKIGGRPIKYGGHLAEHISVMMAISVGKP